jgi:hypothetical protein
LDTLTQGSGFSFGDLAADRAGRRVAVTATDSESSARQMQARIQSASSVDDFFPVISFPENISTEQFRSDYGLVGSPRYLAQISKIDDALDSCAALAVK